MFKVNVKALGPSHRNNVLAAVTVELTDGDGTVIAISDIRVLQNRMGQKWVAMPTFSMPSGGRDFRYSPTVELSPRLAKEVNDCVLAAYESKISGEVRS